MKTTKILSILAISISLGSFALARQGEHDGGDNQDDSRTISCTDKATGAVLLQFMSTLEQGQVSTPDFDLTVKSRGDNVAEIFILDKRSGDSIKAKSLEQLLKATLTSAKSSAPVVLETTTHKGYGEIQISDPSSGDQASIKALSRQSVSQLEVELKTAENPNVSIGVLCQKVR